MNTNYERLYIGKNYIETLLLTLTNFEMNNPGLSTRYYVARRLEEEIIALGIAIPSILKTYKENVLKNFKTIARDVPLPDLDTNNVIEKIEKHIDKHKYELIEGARTMSKNELNREILKLTLDIVRPAILSTLIQAGLVRLSSK